VRIAMPQLTDLSVELLLSVASFLTQLDLLNITLTNKYLRAATEPELFREYVNRCIYGRSFLPFIRLLLERPEIARHVRRLELKPWETLDCLNPIYHQKQLDTQSMPPQPSELEYMLVTNAAKTLGIIDYIAPYELESSLISKANSLLKSGPESVPQPWFKDIFDSEVITSQTSYSQNFCMFLRAGIEDPYVAVLIHMLPNIREILMHGAPNDSSALPWKLPHHKFGNLRRLSAQAVDKSSPWPAAMLQNLLQVKNLETVEMCFVGDCWIDYSGNAPRTISYPMSLMPGSLNLTRLDLPYCGFSRIEMKTLLEASPRMTSLYYSTGDGEEGHANLKPAELINLLNPFQNSLEKLYMDMYPFPEWDYIESERIQSLCHFSRLRYLDTRPKMWTLLDRDDVLYPTILDEDLLHSRLPPNIESLIFHDDRKNEGSEPSEISYDQIRHFLPHGRALLPNLSSLTFVVLNSKAFRRFVRIVAVYMALFQNEEGEIPFNVRICLRKARLVVARTIFDDLPSFPRMLRKRWNGTAYRNMKRKMPDSQELMAHINKHKDGSVPEVIYIEVSGDENVEGPSSSEDGFDDDLSDSDDSNSYFDSDSGDSDSDSDNSDFEDDSNGTGEHVTRSLLEVDPFWSVNCDVDEEFDRDEEYDTDEEYDSDEGGQ
jgi:hypothetical protein